MADNRRHIIKSAFSSVEISASSKVIWDNITNVKIEQFPDLLILKIFDIPKPLRAEMISEGKGGKRIAYFNTGKRFMQEIIEWVRYNIFHRQEILYISSFPCMAYFKNISALFTDIDKKYQPKK